MVLWRQFVGPLRIRSALWCSLLNSIDYCEDCGDGLHVDNFSALQILSSHFIILSCSCYKPIFLHSVPVTGFTHEYKIVNLNKCITSHAELLVSHVVGASSLALGWYEANKYLLLSLLDPVTLGTAPPFCDFYAYVWWDQIIPVPALSWFWQMQIFFEPKNSEGGPHCRRIY